MTVRTTKIDLRGDRVQAEKIRLGHLERLLYNFRQNNEFQKLDISSAQHNIYTDTGKFLGEVSLKTVHGAEMITVNAPPEKKEAEKEEKKVITDEVTQSIVVPIFPSRTTDDGKTFFAACLSGTFEGPYYVFENLSGFTTTDLDDLFGPANAEGKWLSTGPSPIFDSDDPPQLFFVSQSGRYAEITGDTETGNTSQVVNFVDWAVEADCAGLGLVGTLQFQTDIVNYRRTPISLDGVRFPEFDEDYTTTYDVERHVYFASGTMDGLLANLEGGIKIFMDSGALYSTTWSYPYETTKLIMQSVATGTAGTSVKASSILAGTNELAALIEELPGDIFTDESETTAIFPEQSTFCTNVSLFDIGVRLRILDPEYVTYIYADPWPDTEKFLYLNGSRYDISAYADGGISTGNLIKYYAEGNLAAGTVLADTNSTEREDHYFHYIGPYSNNELVTTQFKGAGNFNIYFEIPDIPVPEGTIFRDTFFMGLIQYTSTEEVVEG